MARIKCKVLHENVYCIIASNARLLAETFLRLQEFYESPYPEIKGKHFTLQKFKGIYSKNTGKFTYYDDWSGFNVPGHIAEEFFKVFSDLSRKEKKLLKFIVPAIKRGQKFYIIGIPMRLGREILVHELAHAFFYTSPKYKKEMLHLVQNLPSEIRTQIYVKLKKLGYCNAVLKDETQAYLATTTIDHLRHYFGRGIYASHSAPFKKTFKQWHAT